MSEKAKSLDALTGMRFIAAFAVFVHHIAGKFGLPEIHLSLGAPAVSFFFVLSGFILTYVYHDRLKKGGLRKFYFTRWARIWPLHAACLILAITLVGWQASAARPNFWGQLFATGFLLQSWIPNSNWAFAINGVSWSISTELFFYLMFPLFLIGGARKFWRKYFLLLGSIALLIPAIAWVAQTGVFPNVDYVRLGHTNPLLRLPEFCTGMAIGFIYLRHRDGRSAIFNRSFVGDSALEAISLLGIVAFVWAFRYFNISAMLNQNPWAGPFVGSWVRFTSGCLIFAVVVFVFSKSRGCFSKLFSGRVMVFLGEVSFAFYMVHQIVLRAVNANSRYLEGFPPWLMGVCIFAISLGCSTFLFKMIEMPCKSSLLAFYSKQTKKGLAIPFQSMLQFATTRYLPIVVLLIAAPVWAFANYEPTPLKPGDVASIVDATSQPFRNIRFGNKQMLLRGFEVIPKQGGLLLRMAWEKQSSFDHRRFIHICDHQGRVVNHGPREDDLFQKAEIGEQFVDEVLLVDNLLQNGASIGIGFHKEGEGMTNINKGPRSLRNRRLDILNSRQLEKLSIARQQRFGNETLQAKAPDETEQPRQLR